MKKIASHGFALATALALGACSKHDDNQAAPADAAENGAGGDLSAGNIDSPAADNGAIDGNLGDPDTDANPGGVNLSGANTSD